MVNVHRVLSTIFGAPKRKPIHPPQRTTDIVPPHEIPPRRRREIQQRLDDLQKGKR